MSGSDWLAIDNAQNIRVYVVNDSQSRIIYPDEATITEFADEAERLGTVYSLPRFIGVINNYDGLPYEDVPSFWNCFIRMAVVKDGTILKEITGDDE